MRGGIAWILVLALALGPSWALAAEPRGTTQPERVVVIKETRKHAGVGLALGLVAGTLLGLHAAWHATDDELGFFMLWTAFAVGGGLAGYAAGGGFDRETYAQAMDQGRRNLRLAQARAGEDDAELLRSLRLSPMPGLGLDLDSDSLRAQITAYRLAALSAGEE